MDAVIPVLLSFPFISAALGFAVMVVAIMYMLAHALQNPELSAAAKEELAAFLYTVVIVFFWLAMSGVLNQLVGGLLLSGIGNLGSQVDLSPPPGQMQFIDAHINLAYASLDIMFEKLKSQYNDLYLFEALIGFLSTVNFPIGSPNPAIGIISLSFAPFTGLVLLSNAHTVVVEAIGYMMMVVWAKQFILLFSGEAVVTIFLPLGIMMRAFPFFRKTGSSIIALAFAMYFVFPFSILLTNFLVFDIFQPVDFAYTPAQASFFNTEKDVKEVEKDITEAYKGEHVKKMMDSFSQEDVVQSEAYGKDKVCFGNWFTEKFCSIGNLLKSISQATVDFFKTVWSMWSFMIGFTGDFFTTPWNNPLMSASTSAGLYFFVIEEVARLSPFVILLMVMTVIEIVFTVTIYRDIATIIGGEPDLIGLSKLM